ncbi:hypothetical protein RZE82_05680 [Mollicutes bacterium LVI A0039]|nr:hypothetical protein RZE82_05680 [Mollicutes bacterium LVI A0039]
MNNKTKRIAMMFPFTFMFTATTLRVSPVYEASQFDNKELIKYNYTDEEVDKIFEEEFSQKQRGRLTALAIIALKNLIKKYGVEIAGAIATKVYKYGVHQSCKRWNDSNRAWDFFCDFNGSYAD